MTPLLPGAGIAVTPSVKPLDNLELLLSLLNSDLTFVKNSVIYFHLVIVIVLAYFIYIRFISHTRRRNYQNISLLNRHTEDFSNN